MGESADVKKIEHAVAEAAGHFAAPPTKVVRSEFTVGEDQTGDPAVFVTVFLDDATRDEDWTSKNLDPIVDRIRQAVASTGVERFVYVRFLRPKDLSSEAA